MRILGIVLVVIGIIGLGYGGITWKKPETVLEVGSVKVTHDKTEALPLSPLAGGLCLAIGATLLVVKTRRRA